MLQAGSEAAARSVIHHRTATPASVSGPEKKKEGEKGEGVGVVVKGDVVGSVEVVTQVLEKQQPEGVAVAVVHSGVGSVADSDVELAASTGSEWVWSVR